MLKNIAVNIRASGAAAVLVTWLLCFTAVALFGTGDMAAYALGVLAAVGVLLISALGQKVE